MKNERQPRLRRCQSCTVTSLANVKGYHDVPGERSVGRFPVGGWFARASI